MNTEQFMRQATLEYLRKAQRYQPLEIEFFGRKIKIVDSASFLASFKEIFEKEIYRFHADTDKPLIIDCGANIGLSILFFKYLYPGAKVFAFEPVPEIFNMLHYNVQQFGYSDIILHNKAVWTEKTFVKFMNEGADGGRVALKGDTADIIEVETVRLKDFINRPVDFLKLDIEGAETKVVYDISDELRWVRNIFVEYHSFVNERQTIDMLLKKLLDNGFRIHIHPGNISRSPFVSIKENLKMDLQLNIFGIRI